MNELLSPVHAPYCERRDAHRRTRITVKKFKKTLLYCVFTCVTSAIIGQILTPHNYR